MRCSCLALLGDPHLRHLAPSDGWMSVVLCCRGSRWSGRVSSRPASVCARGQPPSWDTGQPEMRDAGEPSEVGFGPVSGVQNSCPKSRSQTKLHGRVLRPSFHEPPARLRGPHTTQQEPSRWRRPAIGRRSRTTTRPTGPTPAAAADDRAPGASSRGPRRCGHRHQIVPWRSRPASSPCRARPGTWPSTPHRHGRPGRPGCQSALRRSAARRRTPG